jgi:hypothetical protein
MGRKARDFTGQRFGRLTGVRNTGNKISRGFVWEWRCDCGATHLALGQNVAGGSTVSCGCYRDNPNGIKPGDKFGRLTILGRAEGRYFRCKLWRWRCDCGSEIDRPFQPIKEGRQVSCGCHRDQASVNRAKHGGHKTRLYAIWTGMKSRCHGSSEPRVQSTLPGPRHIRMRPLARKLRIFLGGHGRAADWDDD